MKIIFIFLVTFFSSQSYAESLICFGDSQTAVRTPLVSSDTYCHKMAMATGRVAINKGVGGNTSSDGLKRLKADVLNQNGSCVVIMFGANDAFIDPTAVYDLKTRWNAPKESAVSVSQYKANLTDMITKIRRVGKNVTLITPWAFWSTPQLIQFPFYVDAMKSVGAKMSVPILDAYAIQLNGWWASQPWLDSSTGAPLFWRYEQDYQHPSAEGHTQIADLCRQPQNTDACACKA
jgi:lysophospholipase L1-like esterase